MSQLPHPQITKWTAAYQDRWAWMYSLVGHYAHLRDSANLLYAAGLICIGTRNKMATDAFKQFMSYTTLNELAHTSFQHHYHYQVWENGMQVAELGCTGHVRRLDTGELLGAIRTARPPEEGFLITKYIEYQEALVGRVRGMCIERVCLPHWELKAARPPAFAPNTWAT